MKSRSCMIATIIVLAISSRVLLSCASPHSRPPTASASEIQEEARKQRALVVRQEMEMQFKLNSVSSAVLRGACSFCEKKMLWSGFKFVHKGLIKPEYREALAELYGVGDLPRIVQVYDNSPCERAGIQPGDEIVSINNKPFPNTAKEIYSFLSSFKTDSVLEMEILRDGLPMHFAVEQATYCDYPVLLAKSNEVNAFADGDKIYITQGLVRFMDSDTELATVISHELAHNVRNHMGMARKNAIAGGFGGLLLDMAAAAGGVNTGGAFSRAGQDIGRSAYTKDMEREADYVGLYILALSGYDIKDVPNIFRRLGTANPKSIEGRYAVSHPSTPERYVYLEKTVEEITRKQSEGLDLVPEEKK